MKQLLITVLLITITLSLKDPAQGSFTKVLTNDHYNYIAINNIMMWISNNGDGSHDPKTDGNGFYWPKDSIHYYQWGGAYVGSAIFEDGLVWGGKIETVPPDTQNIRVNGNTHRQGLQAGKILAGGQAADPANPKYRVYKIRKNWQDLPMGTQKDQYQKDYEEWPTADGASWIDLDDDKIYTPYVDQPDFIGDEVLWYVANDLDTLRSTFFAGSQPLGLEQQCTVWGLNHPTELGDMIFKRYRMINKGAYAIDSMYFGMWSDPDLGGAGDDFIGVDTILQMGYVYNDDDDDSVYEAPVPAAGYVLLQGAIVKSHFSDSAYFKNKWRMGFNNLNISAFPPFVKGGGRGNYARDPYSGEYRGTIEWFFLMQGKNNYGDDIFNPHTGLVTNIALSGDPVSGMGWYEGSGWPEGPRSGDRRFWMPHGPFKMAQGDTQEVIYAIVIGRGSNHIDSINKIRRLAKIAHNAFYNNFKYPEIPQPQLKYSLQDQKMVLYWDDRVEDFAEEDPYIDSAENHDTTYNFEGYRVWQYSNSEGSDPKVLAVFDLKNNIKDIYENQNINGIVSPVPYFSSADEGVRRSFTITSDIYSGLPLNNGSPYYFAVTAYAYNPQSAKKVLESKPDIIEAIPQPSEITTTFYNNDKDLILGQQVSGDGHGQIIARVINPQSIQTKNYRVLIDSTKNDRLSWTFLNSDNQDTLAAQILDFGLDTLHARNYDGFKLMVQNQGRDSLDAIIGKDFGVKSVLQVSDITGHLNPVYDLIHGLSHDGSFSVTSYGPEEVRQNINAATSDVIGYNNYEIRFTTEAKGSEYYIYGYRGSFRGPVTRDPKAANKVPFEIWNVGRDLNSKEDDIRLKVKIRDYFLQRGHDEKFFRDSVWTRAANGNWEAIYGFLEQDSAYHDNLPQTTGRGDPSDFFIHSFVIRGELPLPGTVIRIIPWRPLTEGDVFEFSTSAPDTMDYSKAKQNLDKITVFPNPYFGSEYRNNQPGQGFVRFGNLPPKATIRIYSIAGQLVSKFEKDDASPWLDWQLNTLDNKKAPSGIYIAHIQMPKIGKKILKIALVQDN